MRDFFNSHSETVSAQNLKPLAEGIVLLHPFIGLTNDIITLSADNDIYGNDVSSLDKGIATIDLLSFGVSKITGTTTVIGKTASATNMFTTVISAISTTVNGFLNE